MDIYGYIDIRWILASLCLHSLHLFCSFVESASGCGSMFHCLCNCQMSVVRTSYIRAGLERYHLPDARGTWHHALSTRYLVPGSCYQVRGTRHQVPGTSYLVRCLRPGTCYQALGNRYLVPGTWYHEPGTRYLVQDTWYHAPGNRPDIRALVLCTWLPVPWPRLCLKLFLQRNDSLCE